MSFLVVFSYVAYSWLHPQNTMMLNVGVLRLRALPRAGLSWQQGTAAKKEVESRRRIVLYRCFLLAVPCCWVPGTYTPPLWCASPTMPFWGRSMGQHPTALAGSSVCRSVLVVSAACTWIPWVDGPWNWLLQEGHL